MHTFILILTSITRSILAMFSITASLSVILSFLLTCYFLSQHRRGSKPKTLPPGPRVWPLLKNLPQFFNAKSKGAWLYETLNNFNKGIACIRIGNVHVIPVSCPKIALEIVKDQDALFASRPKTMASSLFSHGYLTTVFPPHGDQWKKMRKILTSEFVSPARLRWFHEKRMSEANNLVKWIYILQREDSHRLINLRTVTKHYGVNVARKLVFGTRYFGAPRPDCGPGVAEQEHVKAVWQALDNSFSFAISDYFPFLAGLDLDGQEAYAKEAYDIFNKYHDPIIEERISEWRNGHHAEKKNMDDFLDVLINLKDSSGNPLLSTEEIKAQITEIVMAAADNPAQCVEWTMAELIDKPELMQKAVEEIDNVVGKDRLVDESDIHKLNFLKACAKEGFRLHPVSHFIPTHLAMSDTTVAGYFIPKGSHIHISRLGVGRNAQVWDDPLVFKPERHMNVEASSMQVLTDPNMKFISFGLGRRGCVAGNLGTIMTMMLLARLVQGFDWKVPGKLVLREVGANLLLATPLQANAIPRLPIHLYQAV